MVLNGPGTPAGGEDVATANGGKASFATDLEEGHYTITEVAQTGWDQTSATGDCDFTVNFPADGGKTFTCTITNVEQGSITVKKLTDPAGDLATFDFSGDLDGTIGDGGQIGAKPVAPGTYSTTEAAKSGWDLTKISCSDDDSSGDTGSGKATFNVAAGENVTCTYTNTKQGSITVKKLTDPPGDAAKFYFSGDLTGPIGDGQSIGPKPVAPGTYSTTEAAKSGWDLTKIKCDDTDSSGDTGSGKATFNVAAGENVTCTYTNTKRGSITVKKLTDPAGDAAKFDFSGDLTGPIGDGESIGPKSVVPGTYSTTEAAKSGWDLTKISCSDDDSSGDTRLRQGDLQRRRRRERHLHLHEHQAGSITVKKLTDPAGDLATFDFSGDLYGTIGDGGQIGAKPVAPGTYSTTEAAKSGWDLDQDQLLGRRQLGRHGLRQGDLQRRRRRERHLHLHEHQAGLDHGQEADRPARGCGEVLLQRRPHRPDRRRSVDRPEAGGPWDLLDHRGRQVGLGSDQDPVLGHR